MQQLGAGEVESLMQERLRGEVQSLMQVRHNTQHTTNLESNVDKE